MIKRLLAILTLAIAAIPAASLADVTFGSSSTLGLSASLYYDGGPVAGSALALSNSAPPAYANSIGPLSVNETNALFSFVAASGQASISSNVDGTAGSKTTSASVSLTDLDFTFGDIITFTADSAGSSTSASGDYGSLAGFPSFTISNVSLTVLGGNVDLTGPSEVYNQDGLRIVFADASTVATTETVSSEATFLFIEFTDFMNEGATYDGTIAIGRVTAAQSAVPEPASALVLAGLGAATLLRKDHRQQA